MTATGSLPSLGCRTSPAGRLSFERFTASLGQVLASNDEADLEAAIGVLPSVVRLTPPPDGFRNERDRTPASVDSSRVPGGS
jgi:hypothetical protein